MGSNASTSRQRLNSWKEIAVFFDRDERTVSRWEKDLGLPVHRLPGARGRVYAYTDELSNWLAHSKTATGMAPDETLTPPVSPHRPAARLIVVSSQQDHVDPSSQSASPKNPHPSVSSTRWRRLTLVGAVVLVVVCSVLFIRSQRHGLDSSQSVRSAIDPAAGSSRSTVHASIRAHNPAAEPLYLKGRYYWNKRTPDDLNKAVDYFVQSIVADPNYAAAYVGLADCYNLLREYSMMPAAEAYSRAFAAAQKAVELDDQSSPAHASLAFVLFYGKWDVAGAEQEFRRAIDLDPDNSVAHHWYATYLLTIRRLPEALSEIQRAQTLDPSSTSILADKGDILFRSGRQSEAITLLQQVEDAEPSFRSPHLYLQSFYLDMGDYSRFLMESRKDALLLHSDSALAIARAAEKGFLSGGSKAMLENMLQVQRKYLAQKLVSPTMVAQTCALLGRNAEALHYLRTAYDQHDEVLLAVQNYPAFQRLRGDPAFRDLLERMKIPIES